MGASAKTRQRLGDPQALIASLRAERDAALAVQAALAEVMEAIGRSSFDLDQVLETIIESATRLCGTKHGVIFRRDGDVYRWAAGYGLEPAYREIEMRNVIRPGPETVVGRVAMSCQTVQIADAWSDADYAPKDEARVGQARTMLGVPLLREGIPVAVIAMARTEVEPFSERQIALVTTFADQAAIAMENARLINEQREALEQQAAMSDVLQVINASPGDLMPVFDTLLEKALRLCDSAFGMLCTYDGANFHVSCMRGVPETWAAALREPIRPQPGMALHRIANGEHLIHVADITQDDVYLAGNAARRAHAELGGGRTSLWVALRNDGHLLGLFNIYRQEVRPFTEKQIALLESFAAQAVIAMENARLLTEQREALERQTAVADVLQVINANPGDLTPVFEAILVKARTLCGADSGSLGFFDGKAFYKVARHGYAAEGDAYLSKPYEVESQHAPLLRGEVIHVPDIANYAWDTDEQRVRMQSWSRQCGLRSWLEVPLWKDGRLLGTISGWRIQPRAFLPKEIALLENFAAQAVIAMENARLLTEQREALEQQTALAEVLEVINASRDDPRPVFEMILNKAHALCGIEIGSLGEFDGVNFCKLARHNYPVGADDLLGQPYPAEPYHAPLLRGETINVADVRSHDFGVHSDRVRDHYIGGGLLAWVEVPMWKDGRLMGTISGWRREARALSEREVSLLQSFADQAVIAMENARLLTELRRARDAAEASLIELKAAQANLIQSEKMASLGQLTAGIAHEIKNPLNFVNNFASLSVDLLDELKEIAAPAFAALAGDRRAEIDDLATTLTGNLEKITEHGQRADGIVRSMLEHSRGASGERHAVDLNALVEEALNLAYHGARAQDQSFNITLERDLSPGIAPIEVNPQDITRVLLNLCSNGFYAARKQQTAAGVPYEPCLRVATRDLGDAVEIRVRDNGSGIPAEVREKLFQPFFTTKPTGEGTGLGLSITWDIVTKQHGGTIEVASEVGEFTEFTVTLPRQVTAHDGERG